MERKKVILHNYFKLGQVSCLVSLICALMAFSIKHLTEHFEVKVFYWVQSHHPFLFILLPTVGITAIYFLRKIAFRNRKNKGITEIYKTLDQRKDHLPLFKVPSHYINGFLTVVSGGSTGVEVSTVVATATLGNWAYKKNFSAKLYKRELICAGVAAGVAVLFNNPIAGLLFALEVIARKVSWPILVSCTVSALIAWGVIFFLGHGTLFPFVTQGWSWGALPYFLLLSIFGGAISVYFTKLILFIKHFFSGISNNFVRVNLGALVVGGLLLLYPCLYGDSYIGVKGIMDQALGETTLPLLASLLLLVFLKPLAASLTLGAGGDGGVFAPSIVSGAFLGLLFAAVCNMFLGTNLVLVNFALAGMAAVLSASIHAPFTALFLVCGLIPNGFTLFLPLLVVSVSAKLFAQYMLPYNVYTYDMLKGKSEVGLH